MGPTLPPNFLDLRSVSLKEINAMVNIMGVVTDSMPPRKSIGTDYTCQFSLADHSLGTIGLIGEEGLRVRCFNPVELGLPSVRGKGDVVLLRNGKVSMFQGMKIVITNKTSTWAVIPSHGIPRRPSAPVLSLNLQHQRSARSSPPTTKEMAYAIDLHHINDKEAYGRTQQEDTGTESTLQSSPPVKHQKLRGHSLLQDLEIERFYDLVVQVVKIFPSSQHVELYVTDYTANKVFWHYREEDFEMDRNGDECGYLDARRQKKQPWPGPWAKHTMTVTLFSPHSHFVLENVTPKDFVYLRNVHVKWSKDSKMEGVMHTDRFKPEKVNVNVLKDIEEDEKVKDLLRRKRDYWKAYDKKHPKPREVSFADDLGLKRKASSETQPLSKNQRKRQRILEKKAAQKGRLQASKNGNLPATAEPGPIDAVSRASNSKIELNANIRCFNPAQPTRLISSIKGLNHHKNQAPAGISCILPFQNINSRATVRVVDFWPPELANFTIRERRRDVENALISPHASGESESEDESTDSDSSESQEDRHSKWVWGFNLLLEDATPKRKNTGNTEDERLWVTVAAKNAEYLLQLDASDLRSDEEGLAALREKLFLLWGDLEERKLRESSNAEALNGHNHTTQANGDTAMADAANSPAFECCLKEYGIKVRKPEQPEVDTKPDAVDIDALSEAENEEDLDEGEKGYKRSWLFERRWQLWGCTIL